MIPAALKAAIVPGSVTFLLLALAAGVALLYRRRDGGRAGRIWLTCLAAAYWLLSTPIVALTLVERLTPPVGVVTAKEDAHGAGAIVVLGAGMSIHRTRGDIHGTPTRDASLRVMEAARLYRLLGVPVIVTGAGEHPRQSEAALMAHELERLGVPPDAIVKEEQSANTRDHARLVPPLLASRGITRFVLVTSRQHMRRALRVFRAAGHAPVPASPDIYVPRGAPLEMITPSPAALQVSEGFIYDLMGWVYYAARGWV